ncbi:MAG: M24 family metallopeptidase [Sutterella sp.]|nr:M24 family metallopeptidase [Sutterella sp.]
MTEKLNTVKARLKRLRHYLDEQKVHAFYGLLSDPHLSEYVPDYYKFVSALTGFTGSNAKVLVTKTDVYLWTDSRYWEQASIECATLGITLMKEGVEETLNVADLLKTLFGGKTIRVATALHMTPSRIYEAFMDDGIEVFNFTDDLIDDVWPERPTLSAHEIWIHHGSAHRAKERLLALQKRVQDASRDNPGYLVLNKLDQIAWLTALRGSDIAFNPFFLSRALVSTDSAELFVASPSITDEVIAHLNQAGWQLFEYAAFKTRLKQLQSATVLYNPLELSAELACVITNNSHIKATSFDHGIDLAKAVKTPEEIQGLREVAKMDSRTIDAFIADVRTRLQHGEALTEYDLSVILHEHRARNPGFITESFETIAAIDANAAQPHYAPTKEKATKVKLPCVLLLDSGAQYDKGTTDITRVWLLGETSEVAAHTLSELKADYRAVFNAMTALQNARFKPGTCGFELDSIARNEVKVRGIDYGHSTGHGIGLTLGVHEAPPSISPRETPASKTPFMPGMVVSDEPGIYRPGQWGIRLENMLLCVEKEDGMLGFEVLTDCGFDDRLLKD